MDRTTELETALSFVIRRIKEQAKESGPPLNDEEDLLLKNLPSSNAHYMNWATDLGPQELVPRDIKLERLFGLGKSAYGHDRQAYPASLDWQFAFAVFSLHRHPMWGLLRYAGLEYRRPLNDQVLLVMAALPFLIVPLLLAWSGPWTLFQSIGIGFGFIVVALWSYFASRRIRRRQLKEEIERCRLGSRFVTSRAS